MARREQALHLKNSEDFREFTEKMLRSQLISSDPALSNGDISRKLNMSRDNFQRIFRQQIGMTPCRYRISRRMERAQELLQNSSLSMEEVARMTGFCNRYQFSKAYKQFFGTSPGKARKKDEEL